MYTALFMGRTSGRTVTYLFSGRNGYGSHAYHCPWLPCTWTAGVSFLHVSVQETTQTSHHWHCYESLGHLVRFSWTCFGFKTEANLSLWISLCGTHTNLPHQSPTQNRLSPICPLLPKAPPVSFWFLLCPCHGQCILYEASCKIWWQLSLSLWPSRRSLSDIHNWPSGSSGVSLQMREKEGRKKQNWELRMRVRLSGHSTGEQREDECGDERQERTQGHVLKMRSKGEHKRWAFPSSLLLFLLD